MHTTLTHTLTYIHNILQITFTVITYYGKHFIRMIEFY